MSTQHDRLIGFRETLAPYPVLEALPGKAVFTAYAERVVLDIMLQFPDKPLVEIHAGRAFSDPLRDILEREGIPYRIYGDGISLGQKDRYYHDLMDEERNFRRLKEVQREKWSLLSLIEYRSVHEAKRVVESFEKQAELYGVEIILGELKDMLQKHYQREKDARQARDEYEEMLTEDVSDELERFLRNKTKLADMFSNIDLYESLKSQYGKLFAKFTRFLLKKSYAEQIENRISETLLRLQVSLLK
ncbi:hypothetical protein GCM10010916_38360 [Paenibacillus abyssi]|uniref:Uncharacterized protein n=1 Tax=Paenibacillus abyssi TaxID=1340531 RepID=A0A917G1I5_9BACL|nr:hypothetical protein GCM10010916_38360 [Paenibacillus abyssi]